MKSGRYRITACCAALVAAQAAAFDFSRIERWAGSGTNRAALVVDWHDGTHPHALAWGFRWDGEATGLDMWQAITNADSGLSGVFTNTAAGLRPAWIEYRRPTRDGDVLPGTGRHDVYQTAYARDHTGDVFRAGLWTYWTCDGRTEYQVTTFALAHADIGSRALSNNAWDAYSFHAEGRTQKPGRVSAALHYPFATAVLGYSFGSGSPPIDWVDGSPFSDSATALGRPTVDTTGDDWYVPVTQAMPLVAVAPAFRAFEIVSIGASGFLELAFDHKVLDHPDNPYGADFITFGNSFQVIGGGAGWTNGDPNATSVGNSCFVERGQVFVSQDGVNWIEYTNGPFADDFAPTLGRVYDTNNVATNLGPWNAWWGGATDPTLPVDPSIAPSNWSGYTVAGLSRRYRGGAGGAAFDISSLPLAPDTNTGHKWIQYVRVVRSGAVNPEVDAVADVSPLASYERWKTQSFPWMHEPLLEGDDEDADGDGIANLLEYALGRDPTNAVFESAFTARLCPTGNPSALLVEFTAATNATDVAVLVERSDALIPCDWGTNGIVQASERSAPTNGVRRIISRVPTEPDRRFIRMKADHEE